MRILGIDPGSRVAGYALLDIEPAMKPIAAGSWKLHSKPDLASRLSTLAIELRRIIDVYHPTHLAIELSFLADNPRTALILGHARGVVLSEAYQAGLEIFEISATEVKKIVTGQGRADKQLVAQVISSLLKLDFTKLSYDASDAMAIAYAQSVKLRQPMLMSSKARSWKDFKAHS